MSKEAGVGALVASTYFVAPKDQVASTLRSSPAPVGRFLMFNAAETAPPNLSSGWPPVIAPACETAPLKVVPTMLAFAKYPAWLSWIAPDNWNSPHAWSTLTLPTKSGTLVPP